MTPIEIASEGSLRLTGRLWEPSGDARRPAAVTLAEKTRDHKPLKNPLCRKLADAGIRVLDLDPRGMGPVDEVWLEHIPLLESNLTYDAFLLGRPLSGMRVADVVRAVDFLAAEPRVDAGRISVVGGGYGALLGLFAACIDARIHRLVEVRGLTSCGSLTWHRDYDWPVSFMLPGILKHFDLDEVRSSLAPRGLTCIEPLDHLKRPLTARAAAREFDTVSRAFRALGAAKRFRLMVGRRKDPNAVIARLLR